MATTFNDFEDVQWIEDEIDQEDVRMDKMKNKQSLEYAQHRLAMAAAVQHKEDVVTWKKHVDYWLNKNDKDLKPSDFIPLGPTFYELMRITTKDK